MSARPVEPPRVVLDANILARALITPRGFTARLIDAVAAGEFTLVTSEAILAEVKDVLSRPQVQRLGPFAHDVIEEALEALRLLAVVVPGAYEVFAVPADPKDNPILACAMEGKADFVVTDDRAHLLPIKHYRRIQIVSAPVFLRILRERALR